MSSLHAASDSFSATATTWTRLLNVPPGDAKAGGYLELCAFDSVVQFRISSLIDRVERTSYVLAGPGEPAQVPVLPVGVSVSYRPVQISAYAHDRDGVPSNTFNPGAGQVQAFYLSGQDLPPARPPRIVADRRQVQAGTWAAATGYVSIPLGPPGLWRCVHAYWQLAAGTPTETSIELHVRSGKAGDDVPPVWLGRGGGATPSVSWIGSAVPGELESTAGPQMPGYMASGWGHLMLSANAAINASSVYFVESVWQFEGLAMPDFRSRGVIS